MAVFIPGLTYKKIQSFCNFGRSKISNPKLKTAEQQLKNYNIIYNGVNNATYYHHFVVTNKRNVNDSNEVMMLLHPSIHKFCVDVSYIYNISCTCNNKFMTSSCVHAIMVLLDVMDQTYSTPPFIKPPNINYEIDDKKIIINDVIIKRSFLPSTYPGPQYMLCFSHESIQTWIYSKNNHYAWLLLLFFLEILESTKYCNKCNEMQKFNVKNLYWE